jgi:hypothetical protein
VIPLQMLLAALLGWLEREQRDVIAFLREENRALKAQLAIRHLTDGIDGVLGRGRVLICDRDRKWSGAARAFLEREGVRIVRTPFRAPNCNKSGTLRRQPSITSEKRQSALFRGFPNG